VICIKKNLVNFKDNLEELVNDSEGCLYWDILKNTPNYFDLLCNVYYDERTSPKIRLVLSSALSYFVLLKDIIPDENDDLVGYIDDVYVSLFVLKKIVDFADPVLITDNWEGEENVIDLIEDDYSKLKKILGLKTNQILEFSGLNDKTLFVSRVRQNNSVNYAEDLEGNDEKAYLLALLTFATQYHCPALRRKSFVHYENYLKQNDYNKIIPKLKQIIKSKLDSKGDLVVD
jgi:uncharacterized membrane protein YkvA (DUF1232 family)